MDTANNKNGIFDTMLKQRSEKLHAESERVRIRANEKEKENEEYAKQIRREKIELLKMKQGLSDGGDLVKREEQKPYTFWQKVGAFFYCNKAMVILSSMFIVIGGFLIYDLMHRPNPDFTAMMLVNADGMASCCTSLEDIIEEYADDMNGNKEVLSSVYYMPLTEIIDDTDPYTQQASSSKLFALMQDGDTIMVISCSESDKFIYPEDTLENLEAFYPDNEHVKGYGFYLSGTKFAEETGFEGEVPEDMYIGLRKVQKGARYRDKMEKNYDEAKKILDALVERFS
ncbi:MAG: hypothetical protein ILP22_02040 [Oscillospiraceae bacterium]|nr:hypothetical protein [Oscillospiraceae bacterium]